jgi:hypothetical protein
MGFTEQLPLNFHNLPLGIDVDSLTINDYKLLDEGRVLYIPMASNIFTKNWLPIVDQILFEYLILGNCGIGLKVSEWLVKTPTERYTCP